MAEVMLQDGETVENALRRFKRKVLQENIIGEVKRHSFYLRMAQILGIYCVVRGGYQLAPVSIARFSSNLLEAKLAKHHKMSVKVEMM